MTPVEEPQDPHFWLEDVDGDAQLAWVRQRNDAAQQELAATERFGKLKGQLLEILDSKDNIPGVLQRGEFLYNFWKDAEHPRGLWRRTTWDEYRTNEPAWDVLIDLDALAASEDLSWVWHGAHVLKPTYDKALISLSPGGSDADVVREFDLQTRQFVEDGFYSAESKGSVTWADSTGDVVFVSRDFGEGSMTRSGYPRTTRRWQRGTELTAAPEIWAGEVDDVVAGASHDFTRGHERDLAYRAVGFFDTEIHLFSDDGTTTRIDVPTSANVDVHRQWLVVRPREEWEVGGDTWPAGSLLVAPLEAYLAGERQFEALFLPTATTALSDYTWTRNHLVLTVLADVSNHLELRTPPVDGAGPWRARPLDLAIDGGPEIPALATIDVAAIDSDDSDDLWLTITSFTTPTTLYALRLNAGGTTIAIEALKSAPAFFDADEFAVSQHFVISDDGTRVPYFEIRGTDAPNGPIPTLLYGYGGFEVALQPNYAPGVGRAWLERGGGYVLANIRGGGEYGPTWHTAALRQNRHRAYEDFAAVAKDLVRRGVTDREHLGIQGGSNGGLLMGVMYTLYPELFGAIVCQVPLLDMKRFSHLLAGASWMAEYGDPDTEDWEFIRTFSPYHLIDPDADHPPLLLTTSTKDDRVHPGHARKFMAALESLDKDARYYENIEGGHGGAATNEQRAHLQALGYEFLWQQLNS